MWFLSRALQLHYVCSYSVDHVVCRQICLWRIDLTDIRDKLCSACVGSAEEPAQHDFKLDSFVCQCFYITASSYLYSALCWRRWSINDNDTWWGTGDNLHWEIWFGFILMSSLDVQDEYKENYVDMMAFMTYLPLRHQQSLVAPISPAATHWCMLSGRRAVDWQVCVLVDI